MLRLTNRTVFACSAAALLGGVVYINALTNPFVYDDHHTVVENASIARVTDVRAIALGAVTRPLVNFSYAIDRAIWGPEPRGFHVTNVLLHVVNIILLFQLARRFGASELTAFAAAALFAVHPMMTEAVGYISGRSEVLCATFFMLALMCGRRWLAARSDRSSAIATVVFWVAALASKESAAMFPFVFLVYDWFALAGSAAERRWRMLRVHLPLVAVAVVGGTLRLLILARIEYPGQVSLHWDYVLLALDVVRQYMWMMINPSGQTIFHAVAAVDLLDPRAWLAIAVVGATVALSWKLRRAEWIAGFGLLWFLLALIPSSTLIALDQGEPMAEHRVYLASCGLFLAAGAGLERLSTWLSGQSASIRGPADRLRQGYGGREAGHYRRLLAAPAFGLVVLSLAAMTIVRNAVWSDPTMLWQESVDLAPAHYRPRLLLGEALQDAGRRDEAVEQYRTAIRLRPTEPLGYVKVGRSLAEIGQWKEARDHFLKAIELDPRNVSARNSLAILEHVESRFGVDGHRR